MEVSARKFWNMVASEGAGVTFRNAPDRQDNAPGFHAIDEHGNVIGGAYLDPKTGDYNFWVS
jgi:hypothetical protein